MKNEREIEAKREEAYAAQGWDPKADGSQELAAVPTTDEERERVTFAEGVEAALLWALGEAGDPFESAPGKAPTGQPRHRGGVRVTQTMGTVEKGSTIIGYQARNL